MKALIKRLGIRPTDMGCNTKGDVAIIVMVMVAVLVGTAWEWFGWGVFN